MKNRGRTITWDTGRVGDTGRNYPVPLPVPHFPHQKKKIEKKGNRMEKGGKEMQKNVEGMHSCFLFFFFWGNFSSMGEIKGIFGGTGAFSRVTHGLNCRYMGTHIPEAFFAAMARFCRHC